MTIFSTNSILLHLDKYSYNPGDTITGNIELCLTEGTKLDGISIQLLWVNKQDSMSISMWSIQSNTSRQYFFNQAINIKGAGIYESQVIPFSYNIPLHILPKKYGWIEKLGNLPEWVLTIINIIIQILWARQQANYLVPEFSINARASIPWWIDITEKTTLLIEQKEVSKINIPDLKNPQNINTPSIQE